MAKILLVDDDTFIRELYEELLKSEGYTVTTAADGFEGQKNLLEGGFDLVLLDLMLPHVDGQTILLDLKNHQPKTPNGPIIILSNLADDNVQKECLKNGASDWFIKSDHTPEDLLMVVKKYLKP